MISQRPVTNAVLTLLRSDDDTVGDGVAPSSAGQQYAVLESGGATPEPSTFVPEKTVSFTYRVRSVGVDLSTAPGRSGARADAEGLADRLRALLLDRSTAIEGSGWRISRRAFVSSATLAEGGTVNVVDDYALWAVEVPVAP